MSNAYYTKSGAPGNHASGSSAAIRAEFALIEAAFDKLPSFVGNGGKPIGIKLTEDGFEALSAIDNTPIGTTTAAPAKFTTLATSGIASFNGTGNVARMTGSTARGGGNIATGFYDPSGQKGIVGYGGSDDTLQLANNLGKTQLWASGVLALDVASTGLQAFSPITAPSFVGNLTGNAATATSATMASNASTATNATNASAVPWTGVSGRPTNVSQFTNDAGYVTSVGAAAAGGLTGTTMAANVVNSSLTTVGTLGSLTVSGNSSLNGNAALGGFASVAGTTTMAGTAYSQTQLNATGNQGSGGIGVAAATLGGIMVQGPGGSNPAFMSFHRAGVFAAYFGIDVDNQWKHGGWSEGANSYVFLDSANFGTYAPSKTGTGATGTWNINVNGSAGTAASASTASNVSHNSGRTDNAEYNVTWMPAGSNPSPAYSCNAVTINSNSGRLSAAALASSGAVVAGGRVYGNGGGLGLGAITVSTSAPSGGAAGDIWFQY